MLIGLEKRFLFVASTKTASTSVEHALMPFSDIIRGGSAQRKHISLGSAMSAYRFLFTQPGYEADTFFKFGVIRDPIDWIGSWYRYRLGNKVESPLPAGTGFADFWARKDWNILRADGSRHLQRDMFTSADGSLLADVVIPYARLDEIFGEICRHLDIPVQLARKNVSRLAEPVVLPPGLEDEIREFYSEDYELLERLDEVNGEGLARLRAGQRSFRPHVSASSGQPSERGGGTGIRSHLLILSYCAEAGRHVQEILNRQPGYCIRGDINDAALHLMRSRNAIQGHPEMSARRRSGSRTPPADPWYGAERAFPREYGRSLAESFVRNVLKPDTGTCVAGFRSTLLREDTGVLRRYLGFLSDHLRNFRIVFVTRRHEDVVRPGSPPARHQALARSDAFYQNFRQEFPDRCYIADYDGLAARPEQARALIGFLGENRNPVSAAGIAPPGIPSDHSR